MDENVLKIIEDLNDSQVFMFIDFALKNAKNFNTDNLEGLNALSDLSDDSKVELARLIIVMLVNESSDLGFLLKNELTENSEYLKVLRDPSNPNRGSVDLFDIVAATAILLPMVLTKFELKKNNNGEWSFLISYGKDTKEILIVLKSFVKPLSEIYKHWINKK